MGRIRKTILANIVILIAEVTKIIAESKKGKV